MHLQYLKPRPNFGIFVSITFYIFITISIFCDFPKYRDEVSKEKWFKIKYHKYHVL